MIDEQYLVDHADAMAYVNLAAGEPAFFSTYTPLPHGDVAFRALFDALQTAKDEIFLVTWFLEPDLELVRDDWDKSCATREKHTLRRVLLDRAKAGVTVRVLVWNFLNLHVVPAPGQFLVNPKLRRVIDVGGAIVMRRVIAFARELNAVSRSSEVVMVEHPTPFATHAVLGISFWLGGSHHQKMWITRSGSELTAFVGGVNLRQHDWDTELHTVLDQRRNSQDMEGSERLAKQLHKEDPDDGPRHDWMAKLEGHAAFRVLEEFNRRWGMARKPKLSLPSIGSMPKKGRTFVQLSHTYPIDFGGGDFQILKAYERAISKAKTYAYFENQYWTTEALTTALVQRLGEVPELQVIIVLPDKAEDPGIGPFIAGEQWAQLSRLWAVAGKDRVRAYVLMRQHPVTRGYVNVYVHAKIAVIDDLWATIGSANTNNRSLMLDTECNVSVAHRDVAKAIRKLAWGELVESSGGQDDDPLKAIHEFIHPIGEANAERMSGGGSLEGMIVPLKQPAKAHRLPEALRPLL